MAKRLKRSVGRVKQIGITIKERDATIPRKGFWEILPEVISEPAFPCWCGGILGAWRLSNHFDLFYKSMPISFEQIYI